MARKRLFDRHKMGIPCPKCGRKISEPIGRLRNSPKLHCRFCNIDIDVQADQFDRGIREAEKVLEDFAKKLGGTRHNFKL